MFVYAVDTARKRVEVRITGETSGAELGQGMRAVLADAAFDPSFAVLIDIRRMEKTPSVLDLRELAVAVRAAAIVAGARRAIVTEHEVFYQVAQLFEAFTAGAISRYRVFRSMAEAEEWLGGEREGPR